ncbi:MAG: acyl-CoA synthetase [Alphaproteobacteria bacterium]
MPTSPYDTDLDRNPANHRPMTPLSFLRRAAQVYPAKTAAIHGDKKYTYSDLFERCRRLGSALRRLGVGRDDTVSVMAPNIPAMLEAHYGVAMAGGVLNALNYRLDAAGIAFILDHGHAKVLLTDREYAPVIEEALARASNKPLVVDIDDALAAVQGRRLGTLEYEELLASGDPDFEYLLPEDEWQALALNYTSGTTGNPKGVVFHHRGAFLNAMGNAITFGLTPRSVYLWTLPMFHCNGWTYTWAVTAAGGTHVCLRNVDPALIFPMIERHKVTHMCGAPIVLSTLIHAPAEIRRRFDHGPIEIATGGAAPPSAVIGGMERMGFKVTHLYGMTESMGPSTFCAEQDDWAELPLDDRAERMARQGVNFPTHELHRVADPQTMQDVPKDGATIGELMLRSNTMMRGYLKNPAATAEAFRDGWLHTGDLAVQHPDGYVEIKDRSKDIIISGGENISSIEVEEVLYRHPQVMEAAVVAAPHPRWQETPCAFVALKPDSDGTVDAAGIVAYCREHLAHFKCPTKVVFGPLPKTSTGKIQKFVLRERAKEL